MALSLKLEIHFHENQELEKVYKILGVRSKIIKILDRKDNLVLVHYDDLSNYNQALLTPEILAVRGVLIDLEKEIVVAPSFGHTSYTVSDLLEFDEENKLVFRDDFNIEKVFYKDDIVISKAFEGVIIRVCWYNNKAYYLSYKKIDPEKSFWGNSDYFLEAYRIAGGPKEDQLFDTSKPYSSTCYFFLVSTPELLLASKVNLKSPVISFLGTLETDFGEAIEPSLVSKGKSEFQTTSEVSNNLEGPLILLRKQLSLEEANSFLLKGFYQEQNFPEIDYRFLPGEAVYITRKSDPKYHLLVRSSSYQWRYELRNEKPSIRACYYDLLFLGKKLLFKQNFLEFKRKFLALAVKDENFLEESLRNKGFLSYEDFSFSEQDKSKKELLKELSKSKEYLEKFVTMNLLYILPPKGQMDNLRIYQRFQEDQKKIKNFILKFLKLENMDLNKRKAKEELNSFKRELRSIYGDIKSLSNKLLFQKIESRLEKLDGGTIHSILTLAIKDEKRALLKN
jgi:hypothetical protein